jgi:transcriptional regulator with XRE-family HTH domain
VTITAKAARTLLGWSQSDLAGHANTSQTTVASFENGRKLPPASTPSMIREALETAGIEFNRGRRRWREAEEGNEAKP